MKRPEWTTGKPTITYLSEHSFLLVLLDGVAFFGRSDFILFAARENMFAKNV